MRVMRHNLKEALLEIGYEADKLSHHTLNSGGCGIYAALLGKKLSSYDFISSVKAKLAVPKHFLCGCDGNEYCEHDLVLTAYDNRPTTMNEWYEAGIESFHHVMLEIRFCDNEIKIIDSESYRNGYKKIIKSACGKLALLPGGFSINEIDKLAQEEDNWSCFFDRETIPEIEELINSSL